MVDEAEEFVEGMDVQAFGDRYFWPGVVGAEGVDVVCCDNEDCMSSVTVETCGDNAGEMQEVLLWDT